MNNNPSHSARVDALLSQDEAVTSFNFEEFRRKLEASIQQLERRAYTISRAQMWGLGVFISCILAALAMQVSELAVPRGLRVLLGATGVIAMFTTGILAAIYQYRYSPALTRAKNDLTSTMIAELQQQIKDLRQEEKDK